MTPPTSSSRIHFCPECGSSTVDYSSLAGGSAACTGCGWKGTSEELLAAPIDMEQEERAARDMMTDLRSIIAGELGTAMLRFLVKWGFVSCDMNDISGTIDRKKFSRYLAVVATSLLTSLMEERRKIADEEVKERLDA